MSDVPSAFFFVSFFFSNLSARENEPSSFRIKMVGLLSIAFSIVSAEIVASLLLLVLLNKKKSRACTLAIPTATFVSSQSPKASNVRSDFFLRSKLYNDDVPSSPVFVYTLNLVISTFASFALLLKVVPFPIWRSFWW